MENIKLPRPLEGIRVLEYGVFHAGPGAGAILGDLGAQVINIEEKTGDPARYWTQVELCIRCSACIKNCPTGSRVWEDGMMKNIANWLKENCTGRKEPQIFGINV